MADEEENAYRKPGSIRRPGGSSSAVGFYTRGVQPTETPVSDYTPSETASPSETATNEGGGGNDRNSDPFGNGETNPYAGNNQYVDVNPTVGALMRAGSLVPGIGGAAIGAVNAGIGLNNFGWANDQRKALGLNELGGWEALKAAAGFSDYGKGKVGSVDINGRQRDVTYGGGLVGNGPPTEQRTSMTPAEALARISANRSYATPGAGNDGRGTIGGGSQSDSGFGANKGARDPSQDNLSGGQPEGGSGNDHRGGFGGGSGNDTGFGANSGSRDPSDDNLGGGGWGGGGGSGSGSGGLSGGSGSDGMSGGSGNDSGGGSSRVICTELRRQGKISWEDWRRDLRYTAEHLSPRHVRGYHAWAIPTVRVMRRSRFWSEVWRVIGQARANQIAYVVGDRKHPDLFGAGAKFVLESFCWIVGGFVRDRNVNAELYDGKEPF